MAKALKKVLVKKPTKKIVKKSSAKKVVKKLATKAIKKNTPKKAAKKKKDDLMCFLTTACVQQYGLADTCYELSTLRQYRDTYLLKSQIGKQLVEDYYTLAPKIVNSILADRQKENRFSYIYHQVLSSCEAIENQKFEKAKFIYTRMVNTLRQLYAL